MVGAAIAASAVVGAGSSMISGSQQASGARAAAAASERATEMSVAEQRRQFDLIRSDYAPYRTVGVSALNALARLYGLPTTAAPTSAAPSGGSGGIQAGAGPYYQMTTVAQPQGNLSGTAQPYGGGFRDMQGNLLVQLSTGAIGHYDPVTGEWVGADLDDNPQNYRATNEFLSVGRPRTAMATQATQTPATIEPTTGTGADDDPYGGFRASPGYQFAFDEGLRTLDRSAAARGVLQSGGYGRELTRYGQGVADQEFNNYANRLASLAGVGQSATGSTAQAGLASSGAISNAYLAGGQAQGNALMNAATARASGYAGAANAASSGVQNYMLYNYLQGA